MDTIKVYAQQNEVFTNIIPPGYELYSVFFANDDSSSVTINMGTTDGGTQLVNGETIAASGGEINYVLNRVFSRYASQTLYLQSASWNSVKLEVIFKLQKK